MELSVKSDVSEVLKTTKSGLAHEAVLQKVRLKGAQNYENMSGVRSFPLKGTSE